MNNVVAWNYIYLYFLSLPDAALAMVNLTLPTQTLASKYHSHVLQQHLRMGHSSPSYSFLVYIVWQSSDTRHSSIVCLCRSGVLMAIGDILYFCLPFARLSLLRRLPANRISHSPQSSLNRHP